MAVSDRTKFHKRPFAIVWAVFRDDEFYSAMLTRAEARDLVDANSPGSKHKWTIGKVGIVNPAGEALKP